MFPTPPRYTIVISIGPQPYTMVRVWISVPQRKREGAICGEREDSGEGENSTWKLRRERATYASGVCAIALIANVAFANDFAVDIASDGRDQ